MNRFPEPAPCILCRCLTRNRVIFIPNSDDWRQLRRLGVIEGDALIVPLCIIHRATKNLPKRVGDAVLALRPGDMRRSS